jgi:hypothetical protein
VLLLFLLFALLIVSRNNEKRLRKGSASSHQCFFDRCTLRTHVRSVPLCCHGEASAPHPEQALYRALSPATESRAPPSRRGVLSRHLVALPLAMLHRPCRPLAALAGALLGLGRAALGRRIRGGRRSRRTFISILNARRQVNSDMNFTKLRANKKDERQMGLWEINNTRRSRDTT